MNEFDLRSYLYNNPLLESEAKLKAAKKKLEKQEDKLDAIDMKDEDAKEKAKHHKDAIKNVKKRIGDLEKDLEFDKKAAKKEEKEAKEEAKAKKKKKSMKEGMGKSYYEDDDMKEGMDDTYDEDDMKEGMGKSYYEDDDKKKMTKEGLKSMIREKITSILTEQEDDEVDVDVKNKVDVKDKEEVDVDVEKEKEVDDVSKETDIDVKTSLPGESEDVDAILGLLTKASEEADRFSDDPELKTQIGNTITYFTRKHIAKPTNEGEEVNEKFLGIGSDVKDMGKVRIQTDSGSVTMRKEKKGLYKVDTTNHPSFRSGELYKPKKGQGQNLKVGQRWFGTEIEKITNMPEFNPDTHKVMKKIKL